MRPGATVPDWSVVASSATREALLAMLDADHVLHRWQGYGPAEDRVRTSLLRLYADRGRAPAIADLASHAGLREADVHETLLRLQQRDLVVLDATGALVVGAYPFTEHDAGHCVKLDGRMLNAMCAVDALGVADMCGRDVEIESRCRLCGAPIDIVTADQGRSLEDIRPRSAVV